MNCPKCDNEMIKAQATQFGAEYDYCRTCKMELAEIRRTHPELELADIPAGGRGRCGCSACKALEVKLNYTPPKLYGKSPIDSDLDDPYMEEMRRQMEEANKLLIENFNKAYATKVF